MNQEPGILYEMHIRGMTMSQIAKAKKMTRSAVAGHIHRHKKRNNIETKPPKERRPANDLDLKAQNIKQAATKPWRKDKFPEKSVIIKDFSTYHFVDTCRYIYGDVLAGTATFCGHPKKQGSDYCVFHHETCYTKPRGTINGLF